MSSICDYHESNELSGWHSLNPHRWFQRSLCAGVWLDFNARRYWKLSLSWTCWRTTETGANFYQSSWKRYWTHCIGWTNVVGCSWQVWCCWKECVKMDNFALQQIINRIPLLRFRYLGSFPSDYVPTLDNDTFAIINTQPSNMQGEPWIMIANSRQKWILQTLLVVKSTVSSSSNMNRWCQSHYNPIPASAVSTRYMQLFISSNSDKKKLQEFTMLMYFHS